MPSCENDVESRDISAKNMIGWSFHTSGIIMDHTKISFESPPWVLPRNIDMSPKDLNSQSDKMSHCEFHDS